MFTLFFFCQMTGVLILLCSGTRMSWTPLCSASSSRDWRQSQTH
jgi:hypothetical protein